MKVMHKKQKSLNELMDRDLKVVLKNMNCNDEQIERQVKKNLPQASEVFRKILEDKTTQKLLDKMVPAVFKSGTNEDESILTITLRWANQEGYVLLKKQLLQDQLANMLKDAITGKLDKGGSDAKKSKTAKSKKTGARKK